MYAPCLRTRIRLARSGPLTAAAVLALLSTTGGGCGLTSEDRADMAANESVLAPFLKRLGPQEAAQWASDPYDADKRARGTTMLANAPFGGADAYLDLYRKYVTDDSPAVRAASARGLGMHGSPADVPLIVSLMKDPERSVRLDAVKALQRLHNPVAIAPLIEALNPAKEAEIDVRSAAASALGQYPDSKVMQALIAALADDSLLVTSSAHESLKTLTGNDGLTDDRKAWVKWAAQTKEPFAGQREYKYPAFYRDTVWTDYLPIVGGPVPNEVSAAPAGAPGH